MLGAYARSKDARMGCSPRGIQREILGTMAEPDNSNPESRKRRLLTWKPSIPCSTKDPKALIADL